MEHSKNYEKVKTYYDNYLKGIKPFWTAEMVMNAVGKWITLEEAQEILHLVEEDK